MVEMRKALLVFVARNTHDVAAGDVVGPQSDGCISNAVIGVSSGKICQIGNSGHHLLQLFFSIGRFSYQTGSSFEKFRLGY